MMMKSKNQLTLLQDEIRVRYDSLSKRLKQVARYILDNSNNIAFETVASIAERADVPPSTLIRFANTFGFSGFNEMKKIFRQHLMEETISYTERAKLFHKAPEEDVLPTEKPEDVLRVFSLVNCQALQQLSIQMGNEQLNQAISLLKQADNIYVAGFRRSFCVASYFCYALRHLERKAHLLDGLGGMYKDQIAMVTDKDVVFVVSYSPYAKEAMDIVELSVEKGAKQIILTDSRVSPMVAFSDVCFIVKEAQLDGFRSQVASMCLVQSMVVSLALESAKD